MHSSRMRTVRCSSRLAGEVCLPGGGVCPGGCLPGGCLARGMCAPGGGVCPGGCPCEQNDWQTGVKTLTCRNFLADGNN